MCSQELVTLHTHVIHVPILIRGINRHKHTHRGQREREEERERERERRGGEGGRKREVPSNILYTSTQNLIHV